MMSRRILRDAKDLKHLAEKLTKCRDVTKLDENDDKEAWTLAHSFQDIEESAHVFLDDLLPKLAKKELSESEIHDLLLDIGEELRHILYHIKDPKFYQYLYEQ